MAPYGADQTPRYFTEVREVGAGDPIQTRQALPVLLDLAPVQGLSGDKNPGVAQLQPLPYWLGPEGGEERAQRACAAQRAQDRRVQLGAAAQERGDPFLPSHAQGREYVGEAAREAGQLGVGEVGDGVVGQGGL